MTMTTKSVDEALNQVQELHSGMTKTLRKASAEVRDQRKSLLLDYLAIEENSIYESISSIHSRIDKKVLDTWFYEYSDRHYVIHLDPADLDFTRMSLNDIQANITGMHNKLVDLFEHMCERSETNSMRMVMESIVSIYAAKSKDVSQSLALANDV